MVPDSSATAIRISSSVVELDAERSLHAAIAGDGADIVLLHGAITTHADWLGQPFEALAGLGRVAAVDRPGHGLSRRPRFEASSASDAAQLHDGLTRLGIENPVLVAHSLGARTALAYATRYPGKVRGLVLLAPVVFPELRLLEHLVFAPRALPVGGPAIADLMSRTIDRPLLEMIHKVMFAPQRPPPQWKENYPWKHVLRPGQSVAQGEDFLELHPLGFGNSIALGLIETQADILFGTGDLVVDPLRHAVPLSAMLPRARSTSLPGIGHMLHHLATDELAATVRRALGG